MKSVRWFGRSAAWIACAGVPLAACTMAPHAEDIGSEAHLSPLDGTAIVTSQNVAPAARNGQLSGWPAQPYGDNVQVSPDGAFAISSPTRDDHEWVVRLMNPIDTGASFGAEGITFDIDPIWEGSTVDVTALPSDDFSSCTIASLSALTFDPRAGMSSIPIANSSECSATNPTSTPNGTLSCHKMLVYAEAKCNNSVYIAVAPLSVTINHNYTPNSTDPRLSATLSGFNVLMAEPSAGQTSPVPIQIAGGSFQEHVTATADGRLVVFWAFSAGMHYTYSENPSGGLGFFSPKKLWDIDDEDLEISRGGGETLHFRDVYPIAKNEIRFPNGMPKASGMEGCEYPWISPDGSDLFCTVGKLSALITFGQSTKGYIRHVDAQVQTTQANYCNKTSGNECTPGQSACSNCPSSQRVVGIQNMTSLGTAAGFWAAPTSAPSAAPTMPMNRRSSVRYMVARNTALKYFGTNEENQGDGYIFFEVASDDATDPGFDLFLHMNEAIQPSSTDAGGFDKDNPFARSTSPTTADTSGHGFVGQLQNHNPLPNAHPEFKGAQFPFEYYGNCESTESVDTAVAGSCGPPNPGFLGRAIHFDATGKVVISSTQTIPAHNAMTLELAVNPKEVLFDGTLGTVLLDAPGAFKLRVAPNGSLRFEVRNKSASWPNPFSLSSPDPWTHLALTYEVLPGTGTSAKVKLYKNGTPVGTEKTLTFSTSAAIPVMGVAGANPPADILCIGPACTTPALRYEGADLWIDEVAISNVVRSIEYITAAAFSRNVVPNVDVARSIVEFPRLLPGGSLPEGLIAEDLRIPTDILNLFQTPSDIPGKQAKFVAIAGLGKSLFESDILTTHQSVSGLVRNPGVRCKSCHEAGHGFASSLDFDPALTGGTLGRNSPTIVNRAFSIQQFIDRRAPDLLTQVLMPVENTAEMGGVVTDILAAINGGAVNAQGQTYLAWFQSAFGITGNIGREHLAQALTVYVLSLVKGDSNADKIRTTGMAPQLTTEEIETIAKGMQLFNGKARCSACHKGANFTDELMHASGPSELPTKTPTLRGIRNSGPYFVRKGPQFNGGASLPTTLTEVVEFYNKGGCRAATCDPELMPLGLEPYEVDQLVAFLNAL